ncbi:hypothetical protein DFH11DRAFT_1880280 [Phellopilus nigrolimitatus]|nr:hypothetical protein DFH11DRAFT_1880280 [Phellopilus nigrolimitatus]
MRNSRILAAAERLTRPVPPLFKSRPFPNCWFLRVSLPQNSSSSSAPADYAQRASVPAALPVADNAPPRSPPTCASGRAQVQRLPARDLEDVGRRASGVVAACDTCPDCPVQPPVRPRSPHELKSDVKSDVISSAPSHWRAAVLTSTVWLHTRTR